MCVCVDSHCKKVNVSHFKRSLLQQTEVFDRHTRGPAVLQSGGHCMRVQHCCGVLACEEKAVRMLSSEGQLLPVALAWLMVSQHPCGEIHQQN